MHRPPGMHRGHNSMLQMPPMQLHSSNFTGLAPVQRAKQGFVGREDERLASHHPPPTPPSGFSDKQVIVPPPPPLVREKDVGVPGEELGSHASREGGEENMELEDDQDNEDEGSGWVGRRTWSLRMTRIMRM